jgi:hypothetical protein
MARFATRVDGVLLHHHNPVLPRLTVVITIAGILVGPNHMQTDPRKWIHVLRMSPREVVPMMLQWKLMTPLCLGLIHRQNRFLQGAQLCRMTYQDIRGRCSTRTMMAHQE